LEEKCAALIPPIGPRIPVALLAPIEGKQPLFVADGPEFMDGRELIGGIGGARPGRRRPGERHKVIHVLVEAPYLREELSSNSRNATRRRKA
jgi:hypothetical protein